MEFYDIATRKLRISSIEAEETMLDYSRWIVHTPHRSDLRKAIRLQRNYGMSWWDAMIVNSARATGAQILWSEDLNAGQNFGGLVVRNPFL
jgi:predicted nucleic acid-binding protein